ncbi:ATP-binding protein [Pelosinus baikalensis]|uniref:histidine kinase n=1 Tax=Pelosinus baikalensis TaxID=2892015 RepID=A0ABS8HRB3_9FIRM|nr:ATP-binding protein [Pelosinus baikalensis]MCC5465462.1 PAS domain S-box protein [Pelosinus baikalensis]
MDYIQLSVIGSSIGTISIILIYIYLYVLYRERYMGIWAVGWLLLLSRYMLFDSGLLPWKQSILGMATYQSLIIVSVLLFVWATHSFINKPLNKWWVYGSAITFIVSLTMGFLCSSLTYKLLFPIYFGCFVCIWIGITFIRHLHLQGIGNLIAGYSYILWSLLNLAAPIVLNDSWFLPWAHAIGGLLRLFIAIGTLMVYFENTRIDLVNKETQYRLLAENAADIIYSYQIFPKTKIKYISPSVLILTGYSPEEYYADNHLVFNLIHPDDHYLLKGFIRNLPKSIESPLTLRLVRKDKTTLWLEQKCTPIYNKNNNLIALLGIIRDITTRKLEQAAALNMVGNMAVTVAHEIRNPLTTIRGYLQLLEKKNKYQSDKDTFDLMIEEIDKANTIIREYLALSGEKLAHLELCSLNSVIESVFSLLKADAIASKVSIALDLTDIPNLLLDKNEIRQLLLNLVLNSIEAMPLGGKLFIKTFQENNTVNLSIIDQGPGIPPYILNKLGTPFITTKDTGTGLGLPICYQIAHRHDASIDIKTSEQGTSFSIYFKIPDI